MEKVLSSDLWRVVRAKARDARRRQEAIAYVTQDLAGFRKGDTLIANASTYAIASGETNAQLLLKLNKKGVQVFDCSCLHAKVMLLDDLAVISSGNMSNSSAYGLVEIGMMTDRSSTVAGVASFIEQLLTQSNELQARQLATLCKIKVARRGGRLTRGHKQRRAKITRLGNRTWLVGIRELVSDPIPSEQRMIDQAFESLRSQMNNPELESDWVRWRGKSRFVRECREGDSLIRIWNPSGAKRPSRVFCSTPVLLKQRTRKWTRFYLRESTGPQAAMSWGRFNRLLKEVSYFRRVGPWIEHLLEPDIADAIAHRWKGAARS